MLFPFSFGSLDVQLRATLHPVCRKISLLLLNLDNLSLSVNYKHNHSLEKLSLESSLSHAINTPPNKESKPTPWQTNIPFWDWKGNMKIHFKELRFPVREKKCHLFFFLIIVVFTRTHAKCLSPNTLALVGKNIHFNQKSIQCACRLSPCLCKF